MFAPTGFIALSDFTLSLQIGVKKKEAPIQRQDFSSNIDYINACTRQRVETSSEAADLAWGFLESIEGIGVLSASGAIVPASRTMLLYYDPTDYSGFYVDLSWGTVGSGGRFVFRRLEDDEFPEVRNDSEIEAQRLSEMARRFGPFLHSPVVLPERIAQSFLNDPWAQFSKVDPRSDEEIISEIVKAFDANPSIDERHIRRTICPLLKTTSYRDVWKKAKIARPLLGKRGPKGQRGSAADSS